MAAGEDMEFVPDAGSVKDGREAECGPAGTDSEGVVMGMGSPTHSDDAPEAASSGSADGAMRGVGLSRRFNHPIRFPALGGRFRPAAGAGERRVGVTAGGVVGAEASGEEAEVASSGRGVSIGP